MAECRHLPKVVLASRSPRRVELLRMVVPTESIEVLPPLDEREPGFDGLCDMALIEKRLLEIARAKAADCWRQISARNRGADRGAVVIAADTIIIAPDIENNGLQVLGKPPEDESWRDVVRGWFLQYYCGRVHFAETALCVQTEDNWQAERIVRTQIEMSADLERWLDWYIETGEPRGKAGGYAIQGAGSIFVTDVHGSISNVVGLPLEALLEVFGDLKDHVARPH